MNYPVLINSRCEHVARVRDAVQTFNRLQPYFHLDLVPVPWLPNDPNEEDEVSSDDVLDLLGLLA